MTLPKMKRSRMIGLPAWSIPAVWLPALLHRGTVGDHETCGWWLCENEHAAGGPGKAHHVLYCSLPPEHDGWHVWQNPMPELTT